MKRIVSIICLLLISLAARSHADERFLIAVKRNYSPRAEQEKVTLVLDYREVAKRIPSLATTGLTVTNQNFGTPLTATLLPGKDPSSSKIIIECVFTSAEPIYAFVFRRGHNKLQIAARDVQPDSRLEITYLSSYQDFVSQGNPADKLSDKIITSTMKIYPDPATLSINAPGNWNYEYGFFLNGVLVHWERTKQESYYNYVKRWADRYLNAQGDIDTSQYNVSEYRLDDILPGRLFISLYKITGEEKYRHAAALLEEHLLHQPKTKDGGYWHKQIYPYQMWLDGIYMGDVFATQYASVFNQPEMINESIHQIKLIAKHNTDPKTGLLFHGWDESKNKVWADQQTGTSKEFWGRGLGWYLMALIDCLDYIPANHPERKDVETIYRNLVKSVLKYQDKKTNLWFQVLDKGNVHDNWIETSCSAMFAYAIAKGSNKGILEKSFYAAAQKAFSSLVTQYAYFDNEGTLYFDQTVKVATLNPKVSRGDYAYYIGLERRVNDYKGLAALLYASLEIPDFQKPPH